MQNVRIHQFEKLEFGDPRSYLTALREFELDVAASSTPERIKSLRTNALKPERETRDAAIFCVGMSERIGFDIQFAPVEAQDFDFVTTWLDDEGIRHYCPVQLKEVVPPKLNAQVTLQSVIDGLTRYADSGDVTVAIKINRPIRFDPTEMELPPRLQIGGLWIFAAVSPDQSEFGLWGDFLSKGELTYGTRFRYPLGLPRAQLPA